MKIKGLTLLLFTAIVVIFIINFTDYKFTSIDFFAEKSTNLEKIIESLCLSYIAAYFFYFVNIYMVERKEKKKVLPYLSFKVKLILAANNHFFSILFQDKNVLVSEVTKERLEKVIDSQNFNNLKIFNNENLSLVEFISKNRKSILTNISKILESGKYVDEELRILLLEMRESLFLKENYAFNSDNFESNSMKKYYNVIYIYLDKNRKLETYFNRELKIYYSLNYPKYYRKKLKS